MSNTALKLNWFERLVKSALDEWISPFVVSVSDLECFEPTLKKSTVALDVPGVTQVHTYSCAATSSWSVLSALGWELDLREWIDICHEAGMHPDQGMDEKQLNNALRKVGARLRTIKYRRAEQLMRLIDAGQPVLFGWDDAAGIGEGDHWLYAYGYEKRNVLIGNIVRPGISKGRVSWAEWTKRMVPRELYAIEAIR